MKQHLDPAAPDRETRRRKLGGLVHSKDPRVQQQAIDALNKMEAEDRALRLADADTLPGPAAILREIARLSPLDAVFYLKCSGIQNVTAADLGIDEATERACIAKITADLNAAPDAIPAAGPTFLNSVPVATGPRVENSGEAWTLLSSPPLA
jgi:hypothetical protein